YVCPLFASPAPPALLPRQQEVAAAVLLPARLVCFLAERLLLSLADDRHPVCRHSEGCKISLHGVGSSRPKREVVLGAATGVAVALDRDPRALHLSQPLGVLLQRRMSVLPDLGPVEVEEDIFQRMLCVELVERLAGEGLLLGQLSRRRSRCRRC